MQTSRGKLFVDKLAEVFLRLIEDKLVQEKEEIKETKKEQESIKSKYEEIKEEHVQLSID